MVTLERKNYDGSVWNDRMLGGTGKNALKYYGKLLYTGAGFQELIGMYLEAGGFFWQIEEGGLGWGTFILTCEGCKSIVVQEVYLDPYHSAHTLRKYNKLPKKWREAIARAA